MVTNKQTTVCFALLSSSGLSSPKRNRAANSQIKEIGWRNGHLSCSLEYYDFPDEKTKWEKIYQRNTAISKRIRNDKSLMMRPPFPPTYIESESPTYIESERPDVNTKSEVVVIVSDVWKVGDLVDWWKDGCYWSGEVAEVLEDEKVKFQLSLPPFGEGVRGETTEVSCKDLRASLNWTLEGGWTVPTSKKRECGRPCAHIVKPDNQGKIASLKFLYVADGVEMLDDTIPLNRKKIYEDLVLKSANCDTLEAALLKMEELVCQIKWMKGMLETGIPLTGAVRPRWEFLEDCSSSAP